MEENKEEKEEKRIRKEKNENGKRCNIRGGRK